METRTKIYDFPYVNWICYLLFSMLRSGIQIETSTKFTWHHALGFGKSGHGCQISNEVVFTSQSPRCIFELGHLCRPDPIPFIQGRVKVWWNMRAWKHVKVFHRWRKHAVEHSKLHWLWLAMFWFVKRFAGLAMLPFFMKRLSLGQGGHGPTIVLRLACQVDADPQVTNLLDWGVKSLQRRPTY